ncbi:LLM class flavin-dependent oxidoreductase [Legionella sp. 16cNR16C]|uniref:LLM class flavin-dependent oxidoreductase n=1 Tax=Legionella sp. 16cNR16C TaxID=2905656 RepID=UPI001E43C5FF|nr:LLM class flavin-dependent oxidoreductase [Legionella sp. 16cNR16C]MCE3043836.1 LLM class flavin-dependent oxidoreductase [Legionella sp. 16cNR16C]
MSIYKNSFGLPSDTQGKDIGVFLPMGNGGWILSKNKPELDGSYELNKQIALMTEKLDFDFVMSMAKYRGYGGETRHWNDTLDATLLAAAIAAITSRVKIWTTIHTLLQNPAVAAKIITTLDKISNGRAGLNIVTGSYKDEFSQMGAWLDDVNHDQRYDLATEWIQAIKALWREESVTMKGKYFSLIDCQSGPKPEKQPFLICAGISPQGMNFTINETDAIFLSGKTDEDLAKISLSVKEHAEQKSRYMRTYIQMTLVMDETDAKAQARANYYSEGLDEGALNGMLKAYGLLDKEIGKENDYVKAARTGFLSMRLAGSTETIMERILEIFDRTHIDGMMIIFPDYLHDIPIFAKEILPGIRKKYRHEI